MTKYVITDKNGIYLMRNVLGQFVPTTLVQESALFDSYLKASNVLKSSINKNLRNRYTVEAYAIEDSPESEKIDKPVPRKLCYRPRQDKMKQLLDDESASDEIGSLRMNMEDTLHRIEDIRARKEGLKQQHSTVEKEICDIEHYIELSEGMNAYQGWLAYMMLKKKLRDRRKLKDEIMVLSEMDAITKNLKNTISAIDGLSTREYEPRVLKELFT